MATSFSVWAVGQAALSSFFMIRAMWRLWAELRAEYGLSSTPALLALFWALHAAAGVLMFGAMTVATSVAEPRYLIVEISMVLIAFCSVPLIVIKSALTWLGENRGRGRWWSAYLLSTAGWFLGCIFGEWMV